MWTLPNNPGSGEVVYFRLSISPCSDTAQAAGTNGTCPTENIQGGRGLGDSRSLRGG